ncbi:uncharacterized protein LOC144581447 [Callithrix jacchus]
MTISWDFTTTKSCPKFGRANQGVPTVMTGRRWVRRRIGSGSLRLQLKAGCTGSVPVGVLVPSLSAAMGLRGVEQILSLWLGLAAVGFFQPWQGCAALGRCCPGRDPLCFARVPPRCFREEACSAARDCCLDHPPVCPGAPGKGQGTRGALRAEGSWGSGCAEEGSPARSGALGLEGAHEHGRGAWGLEGRAVGQTEPAGGRAGKKGRRRSGPKGEAQAVALREEEDAQGMNLGALISGDLKERDSWRVEGCFGGEAQGLPTGLEGRQEGGGLGPAVSCVVSEWSGWSLVKPCQASYRVRQRHVLQEPRNGGVSWPRWKSRRAVWSTGATREWSAGSP